MGNSGPYLNTNAEQCRLLSKEKFWTTDKRRADRLESCNNKDNVRNEEATADANDDAGDSIRLEFDAGTNHRIVRKGEIREATADAMKKFGKNHLLSSCPSIRLLEVEEEAEAQKSKNTNCSNGYLKSKVTRFIIKVELPIVMKEKVICLELDTPSDAQVSCSKLKNLSPTQENQSNREDSSYQRIKYSTPKES
ncbi:Uncharacterized protein Fot_11516 [Forsythia ovata]|uniref:Uncharacterized protein n=1 Tax=Forsythia ovata TaxID=205694 RepID=A0ABD1WJX6_9LAMI